MKPLMSIFIALILIFVQISSQTKFETIKISKPSKELKLEEKIISSSPTPIVLRSSDSKIVSNNSIKNLQSADFNLQRFKSLGSNSNELNIQYEIPVLIPLPTNLNDSTSITTNDSLKTSNINSKSNNDITSNNSNLASSIQTSKNASNDSGFKLKSSIPNNLSLQGNSQKDSINRKNNEFGYDIDLQNRINDASLQSVSNKEAFNAIYPSAQDYKDKVAIKVYDNNFDAVKNKFEETLNSTLDNLLIDKEYSHAQDIDKKYFKVFDASSEKFPFIKPEELELSKNSLNADNSKISDFRKKSNIKHHNK